MINHYQNVSGPALGTLTAAKIRLNIKTGNNNFQSYLPKYGIFFKHTLLKRKMNRVKNIIIYYYYHNSKKSAQKNPFCLPHISVY